jgi:hypothetical protein
MLRQEWPLTTESNAESFKRQELAIWLELCLLYISTRDDEDLVYGSGWQRPRSGIHDASLYDLVFKPKRLRLGLRMRPVWTVMVPTTRLDVTAKQLSRKVGTAATNRAFD